MKGWECPRCGRCYSPLVTACDHCVPGVNLKLPLTNAWGACPGCGKAPCDGTSSACPLPSVSKITCMVMA